MDIFVNIVLPNVYTIMLFSPAIYALYLYREKRLTDDAACKLIIMTGIVLRIMYATYTNSETRQHDVYSFEEMNGGHGGYIWYLMTNRHLPDFDPRTCWQFYHPPLHHIISATVLTIITKLGFELKTGIKVLQFISTIWSSLFAVFAYLALKRLGLKGNALKISTLIPALHPTLIILSGALNNDMLSGMLAMASLYFTIRWSQTKKLSDIIFIALSIGIGMFAKLTVGLVAPAVAAVFLVIFIKNIKQWKKYIVQFIVFGVICVPIGMFWPVRNYIKFSVPLNFVPACPPNSEQAIRTDPITRLLDYSIYQFASPFIQWGWKGAPYDECNPVIALLKNAMFDEGTFFTSSITLQSLCTLLFFSAAICAVFAAAANIIIWRKRETAALEIKLLLTIMFAVVFGNYMIFCINYSEICTQNMRYCLPLIFTGAASYGLFIQRYENSTNPDVLVIVNIMKRLAVCAACLSTAVYTALIYCP
ncbi:MAG: glycosyltransferase family 39 protein [Clostridia bacterium]|nr:glycosyltransferase family 39 protein [Clostridia bacterium]